MSAHGEVATTPQTKPAFGSEEKDPSALYLDIGSDDAWRALGSPYRMRLFELIRRLGPCTITELAPLAATNPVNLYYHVHTLKRAELITPSGRRAGVARRAPIIYKADHDLVVIEYDPSNDLHRERLGTIRRNWHRESQESLEHAGTREAQGLPGNYSSELRWELLGNEDLGEIEGLFKQIEAILNRNHKAPRKSEEDATLIHTGFHLVTALDAALPAPRLATKPKARQIPISEPNSSD